MKLLLLFITGLWMGLPGMWASQMLGVSWFLSPLRSQMPTRYLPIIACPTMNVILLAVVEVLVWQFVSGSMVLVVKEDGEAKLKDPWWAFLMPFTVDVWFILLGSAFALSVPP